MDRVLITRGEIERVLADPSFQVVSVPSAGSGLAWLRSTVCRFTNGEVHARRRALVEAELDRLVPAALCADARRRTDLVLDGAGGHLEVMGQVARAVPLAVLCSALGMTADQLDGAVADATLVGRGYLTGEQDAQVDAAVERLVERLGRGRSEDSAAALAVLAQACEATAALIGNALVLCAERPELRGDVEGLLAQTLSSAAPLRLMRRVSPDGQALVLDLEAASRNGAPGGRPLTFGSGLRPCPGEREALALAGGVIEALLSRPVGVEEGVTYVDSPAFLLPDRILVTVP
jgi:cytochrome P450